MRKFFIILSIIVSIAIISIASYFIYKEIRQNKYNKKARAICAEMHLPTIDIKTEKGKLPKDKENYVNCSFKISNCENEKYNIEIKMAEKYGSKDSVGIRLRGNSTSKLPKKPYRIKFGDEQEILGLTEAKSWVLLADYFDYSNMKNYTAFNFAKKLNNMDFAPSANHVALFLNGDFKGLYLLTEQMDEKEGRTNVEPEVDFTAEDKEFPFLIEMDRSASKEGITGVDNFNIDGFYPIEIKYPESDERKIKDVDDDIVYDYIEEYMYAVLKTLETGGTTNVSFRNNNLVSFSDLVDVNSLVDYYLCNEIMLNFDNTWGSIYMHKKADGKLMFGPVWDFDIAMMTSYNKKSNKTNVDESKILYLAKHSKIFNLFLKNEDNYKLVTDRWNEIKDELKSVKDQLVEYKEYINDIAILDAKYWYWFKGKKKFNTEYDNVIRFLDNRFEFLDSTFNKEFSEFSKLL
ncbi:MAG: CotH kinase family protein [Clostridia bacterium]|nr:CotH kinase family protein [Clostridia bacterium]